VSGGAGRLIALHGFLGHPADWDGLMPLLPGTRLDAVNLWSLLEGSGASDWDAVGRALDAHLRETINAGGGPFDSARNEGLAQARRGAAGPSTRREPRPSLRAGGPSTRREPRASLRAGERAAVVLAYSFGARLALASELLAGGDAACAGVCLVSCNPGLPERETAQRAARREGDEKWARLFLEAPEDAIWRAWDAQPVLAVGPSGRPAGPAALPRGLPAARHTLARAMRAFSVAGQPDFRPRLSRWATPLLWVTGETDTKFGALADGLAREGVPATFVRCPGAGHRVPWDNPEGFASILASWLTGLGLLETTDHVDHDQIV
jgi:2-succinyl-6-hydroxy-2,4-cyclohexadiene-1-carboxylate synthase